MKLLIEGRMLGYFGPGEYLKNIILNLARLDRENKYIVIINKATPPLLSQDNFYFFKAPSWVRPYSLWEQILIPYLIRRFKPDLAYFPNFNIPLIKLCPYVVTIHDLIYLLHPEDCPSRLSFCYAKFMLKKAGEKADVLITDSAFSRNDLIRYLNVPPEKLFTIPAAAAEAFKPLREPAARDKIKEKYKIKKKFILYVGNHHRHKNILTLIEAYAGLKERWLYNLVIAGGRNWRTEGLLGEIKKLNLQDDVIFTGFVPPDDLPLLYNAASLFIFPSLYEGFGLPPLEAMACGTPVIASNKGSLPEVLGDGASYIDPNKPGELSEAMEKVLGSQELRRELGQKGLKRAASFSWRNTAERLLDVFKKVKPKPLSQTKDLTGLLHICLISNEYPPETGWGGIGTYNYNLAQSLVKLGHRVHVVSRALEEEKSYRDNGVTVYRIFNYPLRIPVFPRFFKLTYERLTRALAVRKKVNQLQRECGLDVIEAPEWGAEAVFCPKRKLITRLHTPLQIGYYLNNTPFNPDNRLADFLERWQCQRSLGLNANSFSLKNRVAGLLNNKKITVTYYPFILPEEREKEEEENYLLYFGQFSARKGLLILAQALKAVLKEFPDIEMVFAGQDLPFEKKTMQGHLRERLRDYSNRLRFLGHFATKETLYPVIKKARIVVLPSLWESFGYTCLEAISLGKVVIATSGSGFEEIIEKDGKNGFLVPPGDPEALAQKIKFCLTCPDLGSIKERAKERAKFFESQKIARQMIDYYESVLNERNSTH